MFYFVSRGLAGAWLSPPAGGNAPAPRAPAAPLPRAAGASPEAGKAIAFPTEINGGCQSWVLLAHLYRPVLPIPAQNSTCNSPCCCCSCSGSGPQNLGIF